MDAPNFPLSLVVTGANEHDATQLDAVLDSSMIKRKNPRTGRSKHLCADASYRGQLALEIIELHGYTRMFVDVRKEVDAQR